MCAAGPTRTKNSLSAERESGRETGTVKDEQTLERGKRKKQSGLKLKQGVRHWR
jgi:hypothetical protein